MTCPRCNDKGFIVILPPPGHVAPAYQSCECEAGKRFATQFEVPRKITLSKAKNAGREFDTARPKCADCNRIYGDPGFPDLVIPNDVWARISPTGDEGGLLCPSCICERLERTGIETTGKFTSGPLCVGRDLDS